MDLRDYQVDLLNDARRVIRSKTKRFLIQSPTGSGKTALIAYMIAEAAARGRRSVLSVHQWELLAQTSKELWSQKIAHGVMAAGRSPSALPVQVATIQTLVRRYGHMCPPDIFIIDEAHRAMSPSYQKVVKDWQDTIVIGLTATPERTDGQGLGNLFDYMIEGPSITSLVDDGWLSGYKLLAPAANFNMDDLKVRAGEYAAEVSTAVLSNATITGDAIKHYRQHADGKRAVIMCCGIKHAEHVARQYRNAGIEADHIHGDMSKHQREDVMFRFREGEITVLTNVQLMIEGVDIPAIECVQWLRPTRSITVWMQGNGRGMRPSPGKDTLIILDHVRNWEHLGLPDEVRTWNLNNRKRTGKAMKETVVDSQYVQCYGCALIFVRGPAACPHCGRAMETQQRPLPTEEDGVLVEVTPQQRRKEQGQAQTYEQLVALGRARGYKNPQGWARHVASARRRKAAEAMVQHVRLSVR